MDLGLGFVHTRHHVDDWNLMNGMKSDAANQRLQGALLIALSATGFGAMAIFARYAYAAGADAISILLLRFVTAGGLLLLVVLHRRLRWPRAAVLLKLAALGGIGYVGMSWCYFAALDYVPASLVALLLYAYPSIVMLLAALFLNEHITRRKLGALLLCGCGTILIIGPTLKLAAGVPVSQLASITGVVLGLAAALIYAIYIVSGTKVTRDVDPIMTTTVVCLAAGAVLALLVLIRAANGIPLHLPSLRSDMRVGLLGWGGILGVALISTVVAVIAFFAGLKRLGASRASMLSTLEPVVTVALASWLLNESLAGWQWVGAILTLSGVLWLAADREKSDEIAAEGIQQSIDANTDKIAAKNTGENAAQNDQKGAGEISKPSVALMP